MSYPTSPTTGATHTLGNKTWTYNGTNWINNVTGPSDVEFSDLIGTPTTLAGYGITDGATSSSVDIAVVFPSDWSSPTTTYTSSGTYSKGGLSDDDYVWIYLLGGGGGGGDGSASGASNRSGGGDGGVAIHLYGKAGVLNGGT